MRKNRVPVIQGHIWDSWGSSIYTVTGCTGRMARAQFLAMTGIFIFTTTSRPQVASTWLLFSGCWKLFHQS